jgi:hypothetical protein
MSAISYIEKLTAAKQRHLLALAAVPDGDALKHAGIKGHMRGLDEAAEIFRQENKIDDEERH